MLNKPRVFKKIDLRVFENIITLTILHHQKIRFSEIFKIDDFFTLSPYLTLSFYPLPFLPFSPFQANLPSGTKIFGWKFFFYSECKKLKGILLAFEIFFYKIKNE